ncbi:hypothetical protein WA026_021419, partial [Henosepilachna vigintioctopunctata]
VIRHYWIDMAGDLNCIECKKKIGKSGYKRRCAGECSGWSHLSCTKVNKEDVLKGKKSTWICCKCQTLAPLSSTEDESSQEYHVEIENMKKKVRQRKSLLQVENEPTTKEMLKQLFGKIAGLEAAVTFNADVIEEIRTAFDSLLSIEERRM